MSGLYEHEEIPLPLVRRIEPGDRRSHAAELSSAEPFDLQDRMRPAPAGGVAGILAGAAALGVVHAMAPVALVGPVRAAAAHWGVSVGLSFGVAYATSAAIGALVGACFASVTRYLRRWLPLVVWALVFFVSLALLLLALSRTYGGGAGVAYAPAILAASAAYGFLVSLSLPLRKRS